MGLKNENKKFKSNSTYITHFVIYIIGISLAVWVLFRLTNSTEQELINRYFEQELIGGASQRGAQVLQRILINNFGKFGLVAIPLIGVIGLLNVLFKELFDYFRFLNKSKLFKQGLVNNLDDDYESVSIFERARSLFGLKSKKYPSNKKMRKELRKNKYFK